MKVLIKYLIYIVILGVLGFGIFIFYTGKEKKETFYLENSNIELILGNVESIKITDKDGKELDPTDYDYESSDTNIADITTDGKIKTYKSGDVIITVISKKSKRKETIKVHVEKDPKDNDNSNNNNDNDNKVIAVTGIELDSSDIKIYVGDSKNIKATVSPSNATNKKVSWSSSDKSIVTVDSNGKVKGIKAGTATITAKTSNGKTAKCNVVVSIKTIAVTEVKLNKSSTTLAVGNSEIFSVTVVPGNATNKTITWSSSDSSVASVDEKGKVTAKKNGTASITAKSNNGKIAKVTVTVKNANNIKEVTRVSFSKANLEINVGSTKQEVATVSPSDATNKSLTYTSSNKSVATVDNSGNIKGISAGTVTITATSVNGKKATLNVKVNNVKENKITLKLDKTTIEVGATATASVVFDPTNATNKTITYTSSDKSVATIDSDGRVKAIKAGTTVIKAISKNGKTSSVTLTVKEVEETKVVLTANTTSIYTDDSTVVTSRVYPDNVKDKSVTYSSSDTSIATVDYKGNIKGLKPGKVTITATTKHKKKHSVTIEIKERVVSKITLSETKDISMKVNETKIITATITPKNSYNKTITWSSSNDKVATVTNGKILAKAVGNATITAKSKNGKTASVKVIVKEGSVKPTSITLSATTKSVYVEKTFKLTVNYNPTNTTVKDITWTSSDKSIATVDSTGKVKGIKAGTATITAKTSNGKIAKCTVTVKKAITMLFVGNSKTGVSSTINIAEIVKQIGDSRGATIKYKKVTIGGNTLKQLSEKKASEIKSGSYDYLILQEKTATSFEDYTTFSKGVSAVIALAQKGNKSIKVYLRAPWLTTSDTSGSYKIMYSYTNTIAKANNAKVIYDGKSFETVKSRKLGIGLYSDVRHQNDNGAYLAALTIYNTIFNRKTSGTKYCGNSKGNCTKLQEVADYITSNYATSVDFSKTSVDVERDKTVQLNPVIKPADASDRELIWSTSDKSIATVSKTGVVKGVKEGTVKITGKTVSGLSKTITVNVKPVAVKSISVNKASASIYVGKTVTLTATISPSNADNKTVTWTSSNTSVATVSSKGVVTGIKKGSATITAKSNNRKTSVSVITVNNVDATAVSLNVSGLSLLKGNSSTLKATITPSNTTIKTITWTSSNKAVATVDSKGKVTGKRAGSATITAKAASGVSKAIKVTVFDSFKNPLGRGEDPYVTKDGAWYVFVKSTGANIAVKKTKKLQNITTAIGSADVVGKADVIKTNGSVWAPEIHKIGNYWYIYYAWLVKDGKAENRRMYVAKSKTSDPAGAYETPKKLLLPDDKWSIDGTVLQLNGNLYFIWSGWAGNTNVKQNLYIAKMSSATSVTGSRTMISTPTYAWEKNGNPLVNEGPQILKNGSQVYVIYSASGSWTQYYNLGQLTLKNGANPLSASSWTKKSTSIFKSGNGVYGPGHASFVKSPNGNENWIVYHANGSLTIPPGSDWWHQRYIRIQKFSMTSSGPNFGSPIKDGVITKSPS